MKYLFIFLFGLFVFVGCSSSSSDDDFMESIAEEEMDMMATNNYSMGDFISLAHPTTGMASVNVEKTVLTLKNFKTDTGPKLLLYLTTDNDATEYVDLGDLKGVQGDFTYEIPANTDLDKYNIVNVWCVDFSVSFGVAELQKN